MRETILDEIHNCISDAVQVNGGLGHRGHVIALSMFCAVDTISAYAFPKTKESCAACGRSDGIGPKYRQFIETFFPADYRPFAGDIYGSHRNSMVHSWNLFEVGILPGHEPVKKENGALSFGLLNFFDALSEATASFFAALSADSALQQASLARYKELKESAHL